MYKQKYYAVVCDVSGNRATVICLHDREQSDALYRASSGRPRRSDRAMVCSEREIVIGERVYLSDMLWVV